MYGELVDFDRILSDTFLRLPFATGKNFILLCFKFKV